jgi:GTP cyclohydrolase II
VRYLNFAGRSTAILADFLRSIQSSARRSQKRPNVTLSYAQSLDGCIALKRGTRYALSGVESQILTHKLRASHDAIIVGIDTVIADNPYLTVRMVEGRTPLAVVLDSSLRLPLDSHLLTNPLPPLIVATSSASLEKQEQLENMGARIIRIAPDERGWVNLDLFMEKLVSLGVNNIMVEGGARVITSFLSKHLVDSIVITVAPKFLGGLHAVENPLAGCNGKPGTNGLPQFEDFECELVGKDIMVWSGLKWATR